MASTATDFTKMVPGFDFLQGLVKGAGSALPGIGQWVAPTLDPKELEKRIEELRTVQFWLEQNARLIGTTIQALEVQRMTLSTLKTMNVQVADLREALRIKPVTPPAAAADEPASVDEDADAAEDAAAAPAAAAPAGLVDPTQWWGALTQQFTQIATQAVKDAAGDSAKALANNLMQQGFSAAEQTLKAGMAPARKAAEVAGAVANTVARSAAKARKPAAAAPAEAPARKRSSPAAKRSPTSTGGTRRK